MRGFFSEVYIIIYNRSILIILLVIYIIVGYVIIKSINDVRGGLMYLPWIVLYMIIV